MEFRKIIKVRKSRAEGSRTGREKRKGDKIEVRRRSERIKREQRKVLIV